MSTGVDGLVFARTIIQESTARHLLVIVRMVVCVRGDGMVRRIVSVGAAIQGLIAQNLFVTYVARTVVTV